MEKRKNAVLVLFLMVVFCMEAHEGNNKKNITHQEHKEIKKNEKKKDSMTRWSRVRRIITVPVEYFFGKENSSAKIAFCVSSGLVITVAMFYSIYQLSFIFYKNQHEINKDLVAFCNLQDAINQKVVVFCNLHDAISQEVVNLFEQQDTINKDVVENIKWLTYLAAGTAGTVLVFCMFFYR